MKGFVYSFHEDADKALSASFGSCGTDTVTEFISSCETTDTFSWLTMYLITITSMNFKMAAAEKLTDLLTEHSLNEIYTLPADKAFILKSLLISIMQENYDMAEYYIRVWFMNAPKSISFPDDPLYLIMTSGRYQLMKCYDECIAKAGTKKVLSGYFESCNLYGRNDLTDELIRMGYYPSASSMGYILSSELLTSVFLKRMKKAGITVCGRSPSPWEKLMTISDLVKALKVTEDIAGSERVNEILDSLPTLSVISERTAASLSLTDETAAAIIKHYSKRKIALLVRSPQAIRLTEKLRRIFGENPKLTCDLSHIDNDPFAKMSEKELIGFMEKYPCYLGKEKMSFALQKLIDKDSIPLTGFLLSEGHINKDNLSDTLDYMSRSVKLRALSWIYSILNGTETEQ